MKTATGLWILLHIVPRIDKLIPESSYKKKVKCLMGPKAGQEVERQHFIFFLQAAVFSALNARAICTNTTFQREEGILSCILRKV